MTRIVAALLALALVVPSTLSSASFARDERDSGRAARRAATEPCPGAGSGDRVLARVRTSRGDFAILLEHETAPLQAMAFAGLAEGTLSSDGLPYWDGKSFALFGGGAVALAGESLGSSPGSAASNGVGLSFPIDPRGGLSFAVPGAVGLSASGGRSRGSAFFVVLEPLPSLDEEYVAFGRVTEGLETLRALRDGDRVLSVRIERSDPAVFPVDRRIFEAAIAAATPDERSEASAWDRQLELARARFPSLEPWTRGMYRAVLRAGSGDKPGPGALVTAHYELTLPEGRLVDSSRARGLPASFALGTGTLIEGFELAILDMRPGERRVVVIPPELAYGDRGLSGVIPPGTLLVFDIELLGWR